MQQGFLQGIQSSNRWSQPRCALIGAYASVFCSLITNYVGWMFFLVSSAHAMGYKEAKYEGETS